MFDAELTNELIQLKHVRVVRPAAHNRVTSQVFLVLHAVDQIIIFLPLFVHRSAQGVQKTLEAHCWCLETNQKKHFKNIHLCFHN